MPDTTQLYGYYTFTHGWGRVLTVMSPRGTAAVLEAVRAGADVSVTARNGQLTQFREKRAGALDRLAESNNIEVLSKGEWDARKVEFGAAIYR